MRALGAGTGERENAVRGAESGERGKWNSAIRSIFILTLFGMFKHLH